MTDDYAPSSTDFVADHVARYEASDGADGGDMPNGAGVVVLTTRGRKSGKLRKTPLVRVVDDDRYVVIAIILGRHLWWRRHLIDALVARVLRAANQHRRSVIDYINCPLTTGWNSPRTTINIQV